MVDWSGRSCGRSRDRSGGHGVLSSGRGGRRGGAKVVHSGALMLVTLLAGCSHPSGVHWPWRHKPTPPPQEVHELIVMTEGGAAIASATGSANASANASFPQYWRRNTLLVDLRGASGSGSIVLKPREGTQWPVRLAFRVMPGAIGELEVRAEQRTVLPVTTEGSKPIVLELTPGIYTAKTAQITVSWGAIRTPAPASAP
ncbi:MAG: hypothetical protein JWN85_494 [Gammaproteobacteria bacterium]|nr:hypothetical protein [Gammaproteobacteria bacterium]